MPTLRGSRGRRVYRRVLRLEAVIELAGSTVAERLRRAAPRAALLSTLSGIALGFISLGFLFRTFARPVVGMVTLGVVMLTYFGKRRFRFGVPGGLVAVAIGTLLSWFTGIAPTRPRVVRVGALLRARARDRRSLGGVRTRRRAPVPERDRPDGALQSDRFPAEHRVRRSVRGRVPDRAVAAR